MAAAGPGCIMLVMRRPVRPLPSLVAALVLVILAGVSPARAASEFPPG